MVWVQCVWLPVLLISAARLSEALSSTQRHAHGDEHQLGDVERRRSARSHSVNVSLTSPTSNNQTVTSYSDDIVEKFLRTVAQYEKNKDSCEPGTQYSLGDGVVTQYGNQRFERQALLAVNRANLLTRLWKNAEEEPPPFGSHDTWSADERLRRQQTKNLLQSEYFLYTQVRSLVESDSDIYAAGNCYDIMQYKNYRLFCPYAHQNQLGIIVKDLSISYKYEHDEFFQIPRNNAETKLKTHYNLSTGVFMYRLNNASHHAPITDDSIDIVYSDGHWSKPYFDCRGGHIWMMTYTVPFFGYKNKHYYFKGTSGIDIDLQKVDIDQCPQQVGDTATNVFANSAKCKSETTTCVPVSGMGFRRGSYRCQCKQGFYFPNTSLPEHLRHFNGSDVERDYERMLQGEIGPYLLGYECHTCAPGCERCTDSRPCVLTLNWTLRTVVLVASCLVIFSIPLLLWFTVQFQDVKVLKAASPVLLRIVLLGALWLYCPMIILYPSPTDVMCCLRMWLRELGFAVSYGALLLKTWRISVVFQVKSAQRIKISDAALIKRLALIVLVTIAYLTVRTVFGRPHVVKGVDVNGLHTFQCSWDTWDYCGAVAELCLLLWGVRLCIVVRKAPSEFNESRFISWAIYNETLLSLFLNITMFFLQSPANPDILYVVLFLHTQLTTTVTLAFLFGSKAYLVYKYRGGKDHTQTTNAYRVSMRYSTKQANSVVIGNTSPDMSTTADRLVPDETADNVDPSDVNEQIRRLYSQLERLRLRQTGGNSQLSQRLNMIMAEAASACATVAVTGLATADTPLTSLTAPSASANGRRVVIVTTNTDTHCDEDATCL